MPDKRVVAFVTDALYPYHCGGKELRYAELISRLADQAEIHVYTMNWWHGARLREGESATFHAICSHHSLYTGRRRSLAQSICFAVGCFRLLWARFDVLEADHMPYLQIPILRAVATIRRKRFVVTWHEAWDREYWRKYLGRAGILASHLECLAMRMPDHIVAASPQTAERLRTALRGRSVPITVAPNGIDLDAVRAATPVDRSADVVVVSRLIEHKRIDMLLEALASLRANGLPVTCRLIGDGPDRVSLYAQAEALGLSAALEFRHDVRDQKELYGLVKGCGVFAFPSAREGFGIAVLEAIACGLRVVTTSAQDNLAQHLVARYDYGTICDPTPEALARAIKGALEGERMPRRESIIRAPDWLSNYSWDATADVVSKVLQIKD